MEAAAVWLVSGKRQPQTSVRVGAYAAPSCIGCFVVTVQRYEETFKCPNIFTIIYYTDMKILRTYGLTIGALHREPRLKSRKKVFTPRHSFTQLKTAWISGAYF